MMTERKPYLLRAIYDWIVDNHCTPHLIISHPGQGWVSGVPEHLLQDSVLVLNISLQATDGLLIDNEYCQFNTRFSGKIHQVFVSLVAIHAIVAKENGEGYTFDLDIEKLQKGNNIASSEKKQHSLDKKTTSRNTSHLKILK